YPAPDGELPDFLPLMLEFAALAPEPGQRMLNQCRTGLELLGDALRQVGTPYAGPVDAIRAGLPALAQRDRDNLRALADEGPPTEQVGLEPFAPPEYLLGGRR
ncbi:MAG: nitrate reductase molybdenum cofactor assembly chaperone, partial [Pseudonocardia sp.]|nr:nitrate reductase molybdenum cofactor assembly chaperone [Pseudonocardia sp.]